MTIAGMTRQMIPRKNHNVTLIIVLRKGRQRLCKIANASRSLTGRKGAAASCVMITAVTPEITALATVVATNFNKPRIPRVEYTATFWGMLTGGQCLDQKYAPTTRRLVIIIGTCAIRLSLRN